MIRALILVIGFTGVAYAETVTPPSDPKSEPDEIADVESREANLESKSPRSGVTLAAAIGFDISLGGDSGVGRGPTVSLRLGHVATRKTVITFELAIATALHKGAGTMDKTLTDTTAGFLVGAQRYTSPSVWIRTAGGLAAFSEDVAPGDVGTARPGVAGLLGGGLDIARWGYLVLGVETFAMGSVTGDGVKFQLGFCTGLSYY